MKKAKGLLFVLMTICTACAPQVTITEPEDGATFEEGEPIVFNCEATDREDGELSGESVVWYADSEDTILGTGAEMETDAISRGEHTIIVTATDSDGKVGTDEITITIGQGGSSTTTTTGEVGADMLSPSDFVYEGAFRLPSDFNWGGRGLSFYPDGNGGAGSLLVTGFELLYDPAHPGESCWDTTWNCYAYFGEISIPAPAKATAWESLPEASMVTPLTSFDGGLASSVHREYVFVSGIQHVPRQGTQSGDKIYGSINLWYAEGVAGESTFPTVWFSSMDGTNAQGMFHVGPEEAPYHGRKTGSYLFTVPAWYADQYLGGRTLVTGRSRGTPATAFEEITVNGGSQGPTLFAFHPFESDSPSGNLDALPMLYYRVKFPGCAGPNVGNVSECDYPGFTMCDDWTGGAFVDSGTKRTIMLLGYKGLGNNCYDEPPVQCNDPCSQNHGYHCQPYERQVIFYDVKQIGKTALGQQDPWAVLPYTIWRPSEFYLDGSTCWNAGGMAYDTQNKRLFMAERGLGESEMNAIVVHVWSVQ